MCPFNAGDHVAVAIIEPFRWQKGYRLFLNLLHMVLRRRLSFYERRRQGAESGQCKADGCLQLHTKTIARETKRAQLNTGLVVRVNSRLQAASTTDQVEDQHDDRNDNQNVDQAPADMEGKAKEPQNYKNHENCPKHGNLLRMEGARKPGEVNAHRRIRSTGS